MGKKSRTKKQVREAVNAKAKEEKKKIIGKKSKKELKKEIRKGDSHKTKKITKEKEQPSKAKISQHIVKHKKRIFGGLLALIMATLLVWVGYLLFSRALRPTPIAKLIPADRTVAMVEINTNPDNNQFIKALELLEQNPAFAENKFTDYIDQKFLTSFDTEVTPWLGRQIGVAILEGTTAGAPLQTIYFAEVADRAAAEKFIMDSDFEKEGIQTDFIGGYLIASLDDSAIFDLNTDRDGSFDSLYSEDRYSRINNNLPINRTVFLYLNFRKVSDQFFQYFDFLSEQGLSMENIGPLLNLFESEGFALIARDDLFMIESFLSLDTGNLEHHKITTSSKKYRADLAKYVSASALSFWGAENLKTQVTRLAEVFSGGDQAAALIIEKLLQNYTNQYFGPDTDLDQHIYPLFENEFAIAIEEHGENQVYKVVTELQNPKDDAFMIQDLANRFAQVGGYFEPKVVEHTLEDGTKSREIVASPEQIEKQESVYRDTTIYQLKLGQQEWGIYYAILGDIAVIANHPDGIHSTIDIIKDGTPSLKDSEFYTSNIAPVLTNSDEVSYFNLRKLDPVLFKDQQIPVYLEVISTLSSGRNYFNDGVKSINYLRIQ